MQDDNVITVEAKIIVQYQRVQRVIWYDDPLFGYFDNAEEAITALNEEKPSEARKHGVRYRLIQRINTQVSMPLEVPLGLCEPDKIDDVEPAD